MDQEEATELVEEYLKEKNLVDVYDEVLVPALGLAEHDRHRGLLDDQRQKYIRQSMKEMVEDLGERYRLSDSEAEGAEQTKLRNANGNGNDNGDHVDQEGKSCVLCLPARDEADEIVAMMLSQMVEQSGCIARYIPVAALATSLVD